MQSPSSEEFTAQFFDLAATAGFYRMKVSATTTVNYEGFGTAARMPAEVSCRGTKEESFEASTQGTRE